jgi:hypothetical protein
MSVSTQQRAIINGRIASALDASRPRLAPQLAPSRLPATPPLYLVSEGAPSLSAPERGVIPTFSIVAMDAFRFPITEARKNFGWTAGDYLSAQVQNGRACLRLSKGESEIQISPNGRIMLPIWVRRRLFVDGDDQLLLQLSVPEQDACLTICTTAELHSALSTFNHRSN